MKTAEEWTHTLLVENERAIKQRDSFVLTGISTASNGGSHDTCFRYIVEQIQLDAYKAGMTEAASIPESWIHTNCKRVSCDKCESNKFVYLAILSARDRKTSL